MNFGDLDAWQWLALAEHELLLFAAIFFLVGALDEFAMDGVWAWLRLTGRAKSRSISRAGLVARPLSGHAAIFIPAWREANVIGHTVAHALAAWPQADMTIYVGIYRNDPESLAAAARGAGNDARVRLVIHGEDGPTTKADCLNRLYLAMEEDERRLGRPVRLVLLQDAEDMVDPAALGLIDGAMDRAEFVQLPVLPLPQPRSRWIGSHYCEEFAESHGKAMVVRDALGASLPAAGVGCAFERDMLRQMGRERRQDAPFAIESLTEDYELGMRIKSAGGRSRFIRVRGEDGALVATRAMFPSRIDQSVRQNARWVHGIAFQGWDRLGWGGGLGEYWMRLRDRRGPLSAIVLLCGYLVILIGALGMVLGQIGFERQWMHDPVLVALIWANVVSFVWRAFVRLCFTAREYGLTEGLRAVLRIPVANVIAIMAGRRAIFAYIRTLSGKKPTWDKTEHEVHPAVLAGAQELRA